MEITIITPSFPYPKRGTLPGIERYIENLAISLKNLNHNIKIVTTYWNGGDRYDIYKGLPILRVLESKAFLGKIGSIFLLNYFIFGLNIFRKKNYQFFQNSDIIIIAVAIGFTRIFKNKKFHVISSFHHYDTPKTFVDFLYLPFFHYLEKRQFKLHQNIIVDSYFSKKEIIRYYRINKNLIKVIPIGIDTNKFHPKNYSKEIREKYGQNILLYVGPFEERKKIPILLEAMVLIIKEIRNVKLLLIGKGTLYNYCKNKVISLNIQDHVSFLGYLNDTDLVKYYASVDLFVFPSELEGFGQVILEAMASGTPVICANRLPMSELIEDGGITFNLNNPKDLSQKIIDLLVNRNGLEDLKKKALSVVEKYKRINIAKKYLEAIKEKK